MKALLVEDNATDVTLFRMALATLSSSIELSVTGDGERALEFLQTEARSADGARPDYILLDLNLPRRSGLEILGDLKTDPVLRGIPVIVLSGSRRPGEVARAYELQAAAYFVKPLADFAAVVDSIVRYMTAAGRCGPVGTGPFTGALFANLAAGALPEPASSRRAPSPVMVDREAERARGPLRVSAGAALDQALANLHPVIHLSGTEIVRGGMPVVAAEHLPLVRLFENLIGHALEHRVGSTTWIEIAARRSDSEWLLSVTDRGLGAGRDAGPGAGQDLTTCERIVDRLGGRIWVESAPGGGAAFFFTLPVHPSDRPGRWPPADDAE